MSSVRGLKDLVSALRRHAERLERELRWAFSITAGGQNMSPADRVAHTQRLIGLAEIVLGLDPALASLQDAVANAEERMENFAVIRKIPIASGGGA